MSDPAIIRVTRRDSLRRYLRRAFITGAAIAVPILVTVIVLLFAIDFLTGLLDPAVVVLQQSLGIGDGLPDVIAAAIALLLIVLGILVAGILAESRYSSGDFQARMEQTIAEIPGVGTIYTGVNDITEMLFDQDTESFREVKLVEYPSQGAYSLAFLTAEGAEALSDVTGEGRMVTVFMPMAPNPMGGFLLHVPEERVYDVDLTVEEGVQAVLSTGVSLEEGADYEPVEDVPDGVVSGSEESDGSGSPT